MAAATKRKGTQTREKPQRIADELRALIVAGKLAEGDSLGHEPDLVERFGVSRPSLREALRILEAEGLVTVVRGVHGGVVVHAPDDRLAARTAALVLQARNVTLEDVFEARRLLEPVAVRTIATMRGRKAAVKELRVLVRAEQAAIADPDGFAKANRAFHERLVSQAGNQTLALFAELLDEIVVRALTAEKPAGEVVGTLAVRRRGVCAQERLLELLDDGDASGAEEHWLAHMEVVGRVMLGRNASTVVDLLDHY